MSFPLDLLAIAVTGLMVGNEVAVAAFIHPAISRLPPTVHLGAAAAIARTLGHVMPFWYAGGLVLLIAELWLHRSQHDTLPLLLAAVILWALTIVATIALLVPRNNRIAAARPDQPYPTWQADRASWDTLHRIRVVLLALAFVLLLLVRLPRS